MAGNTQNDLMARVPIHPPKLKKQADGSYAIDPEDWNRIWMTLANLDLRSGLTSFDDSTHAGYFLGFSDGTPVFIVGDRSLEKYIAFDGTDFILGEDVTVKQGDDIVYLVFGAQSGSARDGDSVTFSPAFPSGIVPKVVFGAGGLTYSNTLGAVDQALQVQPLDLTNTGFTMSAKLYEIGAYTTVTLTFTGGAGVTSDTVQKTAATEAYNDKYTVDFDVTVKGRGTPSLPVPSAAKIGIYAKNSAGSYTLYATVDKVNNTGADTTYSVSKDITVDGLDSGSFFKVQINSGNATLECNTVEYETSTTANVTATPTGAPAIPWVALAARG